MRTKHFVLLEENNSENPVISVIKDITNNSQGKILFAEKIKGEILSHFDIDEININDNDINKLFTDLFQWYDYVALNVDIDGCKHTIRFIETSMI